MPQLYDRKPWADRKKWSEADWVRHYLDKAGMSQRAAARILAINERTMRHYCSGKAVPVAVMMALRSMAENPPQPHN